jgi:hypothetical protein
MSDYAASVLYTAQSLITAKRNKFEQRKQMPRVLMMGLNNGDYAIPNVVDLRTSPLRQVDVIYFKSVANGSSTVKAYNHTGTYGDTGKVNVTYYQIVETIGMPLKLGANNLLSNATMFANLYEQKWKNIIDRHENIALARAVAFRNQLDAATMDARLAPAGLLWDETNYGIEISSDDTSLRIAKSKAAMESLFLTYADGYDVITDLQSGVSFENYMNQGSGNFSNTQWQFSDCNFYKTQQTISSAYGKGSTLFMPRGTFGAFVWNEQLNKQGLYDDMGGSIGTLGTQNDPFGMGITADVSTYFQRASTVADTTGGSPQDFVLQMELTATIGYVSDPSSVANDSPIILIGQGSTISA